MTQKLIWKKTCPTKPGFYQFKVLATDPVEIVHVYRTSDYNGAHRYQWSGKHRLVWKRMHEKSAQDAADFPNRFLCPVDSKDPVPIDLNANGNPEPPKPAKKKASKKKAPPADLNYKPSEECQGAEVEKT